jgi:hypothetical protein
MKQYKAMDLGFSKMLLLTMVFLLHFDSLMNGQGDPLNPSMYSPRLVAMDLGFRV